jgi:DnaK suppressor protein
VEIIVPQRADFSICRNIEKIMIVPAIFLRISLQRVLESTNWKGRQAMTRNDVDKFRKVLETTVLELDFSTRRREAIAIEHSADELDRVLRASEREFAVQSLEAVSNKLRESRAALRRIQQGTFGVCQECEGVISPARLAALPWAALCIRCQEESGCNCAASNQKPRLAMAA